MYLVDQTARARSPWQQGVDDAQISYDTFTVESRFTAVQVFDLWPQARFHTQWPGSGMAGDPVFDEFYKSTVPSIVSEQYSSELMQAAGVALLDQIGVSSVSPALY